MEFICEKCGGPRSTFSASKCRACYLASRAPAKVKRAPRAPRIDPAAIKVGDAYRAFTGDVFHVVGLTQGDWLVLQIDAIRDEDDFDVCERDAFAELMEEKVPDRSRTLVWC